MKTPLFRCRLISCVALLLSTVLLGACNSEGGDDDEGTSPTVAREQAAALVALPTRVAAQETGRFMDLAINGEGLFMLAETGRADTVYSRYGRFDIDNSGALIDSEGRRLMGQATPSASSAAAASAPVATPLAPIARLLAPKASQKVRLEFNLDSRVAGPDAALPFDPQDPKTYNNATSVTVYDAKGQELALTVYFRKSDTVVDSWDIYTTANGQPLPADGSPAIASLQFAPDGGHLTAPVGPVPLTIPAGVPLTAGGTGMQIELQVDLSGASQYGASFWVTDVSQDGYMPGLISNIGFSERGYITAYYSNGQSRPAGQVLLAKFTVADRFGLVGEHGYSCTRSCAQPVVEVPGVLLLGTLLAGSLEPK